ncbi:MAG: type II toxin-antitoxin system VapC family toxin [Nitrospirae bacterium]|nr:MAG: type II toxin-antitoxin system VapC family toxin [Nitrospirota bacterium]
MVKKLTIDSSVIISSLLEKEHMHQEAAAIMEEVLNGKAFAIMPFSVLVEVVSAVRRRTGSETLSVQVENELTSIENISFVMLDDKSAMDAAAIAAKTGLRGMDAIVVQVAREFDAHLVTFDEEMKRKSRSILKK